MSEKIKWPYLRNISRKGGSLQVTIPATISKKYNLKEGDVVAIYPARIEEDVKIGEEDKGFTLVHGKEGLILLPVLYSLKDRKKIPIKARIRFSS
jgi:hypothetical protein